MLEEAPPIKPASVILEEYDSLWPEKFEKEKHHIMSIISSWNHGGIEHIGSTAVIGMVAKPVIDIMFGVKSLEGSKPAIEVLIENGYKYWPYKTEVMHWFCKPSDMHRTHHLHLIPFESSLWQERIKFRELLRSDKLIFDHYIELKRDLAAAHKEDRETYTEKKWPFIQQVLHSN
jgi:GrpB-like predicted nucleotidyltransferase (UPF0157 family)